ncbi:MAG: phosphatidylglycerol lysyltransferase domain-containing protein [Candidatus Omnitrophota bacterium]|nr:DUF2156 domain-containing protein [Candidatus Omnitrophota bacterium]MBU1928290.1 DUF2156 domain-containing protein [Candidatus Omnitrophota bacterium]MBU2035554.1 DUF2156 domain-containing protein [Candidatus Omnitrophota bacterium]
MKLNKISLRDKGLIGRYLFLSRRDLSVYNFNNIYIWKGLFDILWSVEKGNFCLFFKDKLGSFLYLPVLGERIRPETISRAFEVMDEFNPNPENSRIENIEQEELSFYRDLGYDCVFKSYDYLCLRSGLAKLEGNVFKSKRASYNYFTKHYSFEYAPFSLESKENCLGLYRKWMAGRKSSNPDPVYQAMMEDSLKSLRILLDNYKDLGCRGRVVRIENRIKAFSFGFKLNPQTFCILYEITDLSIRGLAQFIFRSFCSELKGNKYINVMDDSGLENLKKVKLSYHPVKLIPSYIAKRKNLNRDSDYFSHSQVGGK